MAGTREEVLYATSGNALQLPRTVVPLGAPITHSKLRYPDTLLKLRIGIAIRIRYADTVSAKYWKNTAIKINKTNPDT
jgi:hypothetical protein